MSSGSEEQLDREVLQILSSLIAFKTRAEGKGWRDAFENMPVYMKVGATPSDDDVLFVAI
jgi:hypothetical protein